jgi:hypothetical protein
VCRCPNHRPRPRFNPHSQPSSPRFRSTASFPTRTGRTSAIYPHVPARSGSERRHPLGSVTNSVGFLMDIHIIPRTWTRHLTDDPERRIHMNGFLSGIVVASGIVLVGLFPNAPDHLPHVCLFTYLTEHPCPSCGFLRSIAALSRGDFETSWAFHPLGFLFLAGVCVQIILSVVAICSPKLSSSVVRVLRASATALSVSLVLIWLHSFVW